MFASDVARWNSMGCRSNASMIFEYGDAAISDLDGRTFASIESDEALWHPQ